MFGGVDLAKEDARDARGTRWVEDWARDTRVALRGMARSPGFTAAAVVTLAIGIGATTAVWSIMDALMLRTLPVDRPAEIRAVRRVGVTDDSYLVSYIQYQRLRRALPDSNALTGMSSQFSMYAQVANRPVSVNAQLVTGNWFRLLGVGTQLGRPLGPSDDLVVGGHPVVVLSESFWRNRLGADSGVIGSVLRVNGADLAIVGVVASGFTGLTIGSPVDLWIPAAMQYEVKFHGDSYTLNASTARPWVPQYGVHWLTLIARVEPGSVTATQSRLNAQFRLEQEEEVRTSRPDAGDAHVRETLAAEPLSHGFSGLRDSFSEPLRMLFLSVGIILLIACGNLAGLLLARGAARTHEIAVRVSLGAGRVRLIRQALTECLTLALIGGALSILVAYWGSRTLLRVASSGESTIPLHVPIDARMLLFALATTLLAGLLFGLAPALLVSRTTLYDSFKTGGRVVTAGGTHRLPLGRTLLIAQIALSLVLVASAGLFARTFQNFLSINPGFDADHVIAARIDVLASGYTGEQLPALYDRLTTAARTLPGVTSVALSWLTLGTGGVSVGEYIVAGRTFALGGNTAQMNYVTPEFFGTTGMTLLRGRDFRASDDANAPDVAIISARMARDFFGTLDVVGRRFGFDAPDDFEIVGVVRDARVNAIKRVPQRLVFYPLAQSLRPVTNVTVRASGSPDAVAVALRNAIHAVDPNLPLRDALTIRTLHERGLSRERMLARIAGALGFLALLLVGIGLYGIVAYSVSRRTNEMGVRLALGASPSKVSSIVLRDSIQTVGAGLLVGLILALPALRLTQRLVYGVGPHDPRNLAISAGLLLAVGVVAALIPALRASRINPIEAIRAE
jgi:predicted permease